MSELSATNCGCGCDNNSSLFGGNGCNISPCFLIIILLFFCGGMGNSWNRSGSGCGCGCDWIWIILLLFFCGNGCGNDCDNRSGCGCGC